MNEPLIGQALLEYVDTNKNKGKREIAIGANYTSPTGRPQMTKFSEAILEASGISLASKKGDGRGREKTYIATVHKNQQIVLGAGYTQHLKVGTAFRIRVGKKAIVLELIQDEVA